MENWTNEIWVAIGIAFIVGLFIGYIIVRLTKGSVKHQAKTEAELKTVKTQLDTQKAQIEKHFAESAELFKTLINDYQKLYRHYATSSNNLLGEKEHKGLFTQQLITATDKSCMSAKKICAVKMLLLLEPISANNLSIKPNTSLVCS